MQSGFDGLFVNCAELIDDPRARVVTVGFAKRSRATSNRTCSSSTRSATSRTATTPPTCSSTSSTSVTSSGARWSSRRTSTRSAGARCCTTTTSPRSSSIVCSSEDGCCAWTGRRSAPSTWRTTWTRATIGMKPSGSEFLENAAQIFRNLHRRVPDGRHRGSGHRSDHHLPSTALPMGHPRTSRQERSRQGWASAVYSA